MDTQRLSNLLFLSGLAAVGMSGCDINIDSGDDDTSASTSGGSSGNDSSGSGDTEGSASASASASESDTASSESASASASDTAADSTTSVGTSDTAGSEVCTEYATVFSGCDSAAYPYEASLEYCEYTLGYLGGVSAECVSAYEELLVCVLALPCEKILSEELPPECQSASDNLQDLCGIGGTGTSGGSGGSTGGSAGSTGG